MGRTIRIGVQGGQSDAAPNRGGLTTSYGVPTMATTRREFLKASVASGSILTLGGSARHVLAAGDDRAESPRGGGMNLLVLGGTVFLGPAIVEAAKARGHTVTLFNRGKTNPKLFPDLEK